jgi:hypothetical protein
MAMGNTSWEEHYYPTHYTEEESVVGPLVSYYNNNLPTSTDMWR